MDFRWWLGCFEALFYLLEQLYKSRDHCCHGHLIQMLPTTVSADFFHEPGIWSAHETEIKMLSLFTFSCNKLFWVPIFSSWLIQHWTISRIYELMNLKVLITEQMDCICPLWWHPSLEAWCRSLVVCSGFYFKRLAFCCSQANTEPGTTFCPEIWPWDAIFTCSIHLLYYRVHYFVK